MTIKPGKPRGADCRPCRKPTLRKMSSMEGAVDSVTFDPPDLDENLVHGELPSTSMQPLELQPVEILKVAKEIDQERMRSFGRDVKQVFQAIVLSPPSNCELDDLKKTIQLGKFRPMLTRIINGADPEFVAADGGVSLDMMVHRAALLRYEFDCRNRRTEREREEEARVLEG